MSRRRCGGKLFHTRGPAAPKLRSPKLLCVRGTRHVLAAAERSWRRSLSVTSWMSLAMYAGVWPASDCMVYQACNLVLDSLTDRQPMQLTQHRCDVVTSSSSCDQTCSGVLNGLNLPQKAVWHAVQHRVAVVQTTAAETHKIACTYLIYAVMVTCSVWSSFAVWWSHSLCIWLQESDEFKKNDLSCLWS